MGLIHKTKFVPFIDTSKTDTPTWVQLEKSTNFSISFNPQEKTFDFISSESPQTEIDSYQPSLSQSITMYDDQPDFDAIFDMCFNLPTGGDAHRKVLLAFYARKSEALDSDTTYYEAWLVDSVVKLGTLDSVNQTIDFDLPLNKHETGAVTLDGSGVPTWVKGTWTDGVFTPSV